MNSSKGMNSTIKINGIDLKTNPEKFTKRSSLLPFLESRIQMVTLSTNIEFRDVIKLKSTNSKTEFARTSLRSMMSTTWRTATVEIIIFS